MCNMCVCVFGDAGGSRPLLRPLHPRTSPLQDQLQQAKAEYARGLARLKSSAGALQSLGSRVQSSEKAAKGEWESFTGGGQ